MGFWSSIGSAISSVCSSIGSTTSHSNNQQQESAEAYIKRIEKEVHKEDNISVKNSKGKQLDREIQTIKEKYQVDLSAEFENTMIETDLKSREMKNYIDNFKL